MVEKVYGTKANTALNSDSVTDDSVLLKWVGKKKKQIRLDEQPSFAAVTAQMQMRNGALIGGGWQQKEIKTAKTAVGAEPVKPLSRSDEGLRKKVMLAASARADATQFKPLTTGDRPAVVAGPMKTKENGSMPRTAVAPVRKADAQVPSQPEAVGAKRAETTVISQPLAPLVTKNESTSRHLASPLQHKNKLNEEKPRLVPGKTLDFRTNVQSEQQVQSKSVSAALEQLKGQDNAAMAAPPDKKAQTLEVNYTFQRWSGDHSVKVTIPAQALREGNMTLLPSDARAADALSRNLGTLAGHSLELLQPRQEKDEQQKREQQPQQDEELE